MKERSFIDRHLFLDASSPLLHLRVELLIRAHICFISVFHMDGLCTVLDHARHLAFILRDLNAHQLLIRLLISLERYSEMIYVFDILFESDQFELLLSTVSQKNDANLNTALIDYVKRYHPDAEDTLALISMHLNMHHKLARMHRDTGEKLLKTFQENQSTSPITDMSVTLQSLCRYYSDAADAFYLAGSCRQSEHCLKQARLVSLQLELLRQQPIEIILNLDTKQIHDFLPRCNNCWHAFIIADAYNEHSVWAACLVEQFICNKNPDSIRYWNDFRQLVPIDDDLIYNIGLNLLKKNVNAISQSHFQEILSHVEDVTVLLRLNHTFQNNNSGLSHLFTTSDSTYLLDMMRA